MNLVFNFFFFFLINKGTKYSKNKEIPKKRESQLNLSTANIQQFRFRLHLLLKMTLEGGENLG